MSALLDTSPATTPTLASAAADADGGAVGRGRPMADMTAAGRFILAIDKSAAEGCWRWTGRLDRRGYARFSVGGRKVFAHRFAYELCIGLIADGLELDHTCHTEALARGECGGDQSCPHRACVNPAHLEPVTPLENWRRSNSITNANARKTHCPHGHEYTEANTEIWTGRGRAERSCRTCARQRQRGNTRKARVVTSPNANTLKTHCPAGHAYDDVNTYVDPRGRRHCRTCKRTRDAQRNRGRVQ